MIAIGGLLVSAAEPTAAHADAVLDAMSPWSTGGVLPNFAPSEDPAQVRRRYDGATLTRLATLAAAYDPSGVIRAARPVREACDERPA